MYKARTAYIFLFRFGPSPLENVGFQYGFTSQALRNVVDYWLTKYKWEEREQYLNKYPHFKTEIQGIDLHYIHVKPASGKGKPLLLLHGWPGSFIEFYPLIENFQKSGLESDAQFEFIIPSLPGYAWSSASVRPGLNTAHMAVILAELMTRLGHEKFYVQGGDWGSQVASHLGLFFPKRVLGLHLNLCTSLSLRTNLAILVASIWPRLFMDEMFVQKMYPLSTHFSQRLLETGYFHIQATKPDTVGAGLTDSPAGLAAYILEKFSTGTNKTYRDRSDGGLLEKYSYETLLDNVMIYWITGSMTSAMRLYAEQYTKENRNMGLDSIQVLVPTWCARFPGELAYLPNWIIKHRYPNLVGATNMPRGGHFAALEETELLANDIRKAIEKFDSLIRN